ncbi:hypothetical protein BDR05DRAFT_958461 [Suillus weaverae]|nr:hypothetical protein BDR05DRAFT_958461 [Suillus weaverae]
MLPYHEAAAVTILTLRLLRDFDEKLMMSHPCEHLRREINEVRRGDGEMVVSKDTEIRRRTY